VELLSSGFDKPHCSQDWIPRFPRITKIHIERDWRNGISKRELQALGEEALKVGGPREQTYWEERLGVVDRVHCAGGTVVPGKGVKEYVREESRRDVYNGVRVQFGLDVEGILAKGEGIKRKRVEEEKERKKLCVEEKVLTSKNRCLEDDKENQVPQEKMSVLHLNPAQRPEDTPARVVLIQKIQFSPSSVILGIARKATWTSLYGGLDVVPVYMDEHLPMLLSYGCEDTVVLVERRKKELVKRTLQAVREASVHSLSRWWVFDSKIVGELRSGCVNWDYHNLFTYMNGNVC
jgi:hypothetical protein